MRIAVVGMGVMGLTTGAGFADLGHSVECVDLDNRRIADLARGIINSREPGLESLLLRNRSAGRLSFNHDPAKLHEDTELIMIAMDTPVDESGEMLLSGIWTVIDQLTPGNQNIKRIIALKSSVPVGTSDRIETRLRGRMPQDQMPDVVYIPDFMREGYALRDFYEPSRIVIGAASQEAAERLSLLYARLPGPILKTDRRSAELAKLAANAFLAVKISFANEMAALAEQTGADYPTVAQSLSLDPRIGPYSLGAGIGFGGSFLPKDARALVLMADEAGAPQTLLEASVRANAMLPLRMVRRLEAAISDPSRRKVAILGLAYKPGTNDLREAPALRVISELLRRHPGIVLTAYDPEISVMKNPAIPATVSLCASAEEALTGADAAIVATEWREFKQISPEHFKKWMNRPIIMDGRNTLDSVALNAQGVVCIGVGHVPASPQGNGQRHKLPN
ncbi:MAG: UDP-glucose/GDP-mannose dehydrogenase family protein [Candidatus Cohnella colombiensis]|uniref:UDP-glucose 6-dehydrogenase n=1 Tax=Candidatus Cohnella colombiensis TaxID=3121368 RepID=A0AA95EUY1_9BACL|nr:MAG: UDP-glucose/GDP-mannose dehydrogenase family protein [Cohnella sp.]